MCRIWLWLIWKSHKVRKKQMIGYTNSKIPHPPYLSYTPGYYFFCIAFNIELLLTNIIFTNKLLTYLFLHAAFCVSLSVFIHCHRLFIICLSLKKKNPKPLHVFWWWIKLYNYEIKFKKSADSPESPIGRYRLLSESDIGAVYSQDSHNSLVQA